MTRRIGANLSVLFADAPLLERFALAARAGFGAVEMQFDYADAAPEALAAAARDAEVEVALINALVERPGAPFTSGDPDARAAFRDAIETAKRYCAALACPKINVLPPQAIAGLGRATQVAVYQENLAHAAEALAAEGARVVAEPVNTRDRPEMLVGRIAEMAEVLEGVGRDDLALQFDVYHVARMDDPPAETFTRFVDRIGHVQFADAPGRHEPGTGDVDFEAVFAAIDASGYDGWINAEYVPSGRTEDGLGWLGRLSSAEPSS